MKIKERMFHKIIVPERMIFNTKVHKITGIAPQYIIKEYIVKTVDKKIDTVCLKSSHPNCDPNTKQFCIPHMLRQYKFNKESQKMLEFILGTFNLDDCYFKPWNDIRYMSL